ncbi:MAG: phosphoribosyltransferase family protein, partial [Planctomycetota bacterium]
LEYGTDAVEMHRDAVARGDRILLVDDLLATGGTASAAIRLIQGLGAEVVGATFLVELTFLGGRARLAGVPVFSVIQYDR